MSGKITLLSTSALITFIMAPAAYAQTQPADEIIVTATKRQQTLQEIPIAVSVTSGAEIERAAIQDLNDLQSLVPSLRVEQRQSVANTNFVIRGFGNGANNPGIEPSVGVFIDGVYRSRSAAQIADLPDLERVEVLRGPQSTLFGKNASAGVISVVTAKPSFEWAGFVEAGYGNYNQKKFKGKITGPISDTLAFSLFGNYNNRNGYFTNLKDGNDFNDRNRWDLRGDLLFEPTEKMSFRLIADYGEVDESCCGVGNILGGPNASVVSDLGGFVSEDLFSRETFYNKLPTNDIQSGGLSLTGDIDFDKFTLTTISSYRSVDALETFDGDFTGADVFGESDIKTDIETLTQEIRLTSNGQGSVDWMVGGFFFDENVDYRNLLAHGADARAYADGFLTPSGINVTLLEILSASEADSFLQEGQRVEEIARQDNTAYSFFGTVDWHATDRLTATVGLNYTNDKKKVSLRQDNNAVFSAVDLLTANNGLIPLLFGGDENVIPIRGLQFMPRFVDFPNSVEDGRTKDDKVTYTLRLAYDITDSVNIYGSYATGFKATSWNLSRDSRPLLSDQAAIEAAMLDQPNQTYGTRLAGPENAEVIELGLKGKWDRFAINLAIFDQQIKGFQSNAFTGSGFNFANAGLQSTRGIEFDTLFSANDHVDFSFSGTLMDPEYDEFVGGRDENGPADLSGRTPAGIHEVSLSTAATYKWTSGKFDGYVRADFLYESDVQVNDIVAESVATREVKQINASTGVSFDDWNIQLYARNLTKQNYIARAFPSPVPSESVSAYPNAPRTYGINVKKRF